jgi:hypothetical protein
MALEGLSREQIDKFEARLMQLVPEAEPVGNVTLRTNLIEEGWSEELYWEIRNRLISRGTLTTGKGKGGSVRRVPPILDAPAPPPMNGAAPIPVVVLAERELYGPMAEVIRTRWANEHRFDSLVVEITAAQGARPTGGKWTRPDITAATVKTYPYVPGRHFDVITFEIKPTDAIDVTVIYEALGHRRAASRSYALIHIPENRQQELDPLLDDIEIEAKRFGIGLIVAADPSNYDTWDERVEAVRYEPDPERLNDFLGAQVSQGFREQMIKWFK